MKQGKMIDCEIICPVCGKELKELKKTEKGSFFICTCCAEIYIPIKE